MSVRAGIYFVMLVLLWLADFSQASEEGAEQEESERCINARSIRRTEVIDDNNVIFYVQGRKTFLNTLPKSCKGLSRDRRFSFETYTRSLCERDRIKVLEEAGDGFYEGRSCKLGRFLPVTQEDIENFYKDRTQPPEPRKLEPPPVEEVISDESEQQEPGE